MLTWISLAPLRASVSMWKMRGWAKQQPGIEAQVPMPLEHTGQLPRTKAGRGGSAESYQVLPSTPSIYTRPPLHPGRPPVAHPRKQEENAEEGL